MTETDPGTNPPAGEEDNETTLAPPGKGPEEGAWRMAMEGYLAHSRGTGAGGATPAPGAATRSFRSRKGVPDRLGPERP